MTSSPEVIQLKKAGDCLAMRVTSCERMKVGTYPEVEFIGVDEGGRTIAVRVPEKSSDRQLERAELTRDSVVGLTLLFTRDANAQDPRKPFWGIVVADESINAPQRVATTAPGSPASNGNGGNGAQATTGSHPAPVRERASDLYKNVTRFALDTIAPMYEAKQMKLSPSDIKEIVATIYITAARG